jgi:hypothetical protein
MRHCSRFALIALAGAVAACGGGRTLRSFGDVQPYAPRVEFATEERFPKTVTLGLERDANVALLYVVPGRGARLIYPTDTTAQAFLSAGEHTVETTFARETPDDTTRRQPAIGVRDPAQQVPPARGDRVGAFGDTLPTVRNVLETGLGRGFLMLYMADDPLSPAAIVRRVEGMSIPMDDTEALNTVAKLVRSTTTGGQRWGAYAVGVDR